MDTLLRVLAFVLGLGIVIGTLISAVQTFVLPRSARDQLTRIIFQTMWRIFRLILKGANTYEERDRIMAFFAPITLLMMPPVWLVLVLVGYTCMFWAIDLDLRGALTESGSSMLTLGFASLPDFISVLLAFSEASVGLILVALLIAYLPTMYSAFQRREMAVTLLEVRAGSPPSAVEMLKRFHRIRGLEKLTEVWVSWESWFVDIEESHTSLAPLVFFRSPQPHRSWVTAAGAILDAASLYATTIDGPRSPEAELCIRAGFLALRKISDFFSIEYDPKPQKGDIISITKDEFMAAYDELAAAGVPLKPDREDAWQNFAGWRVNYDTVLLALAAITLAPEAPWSSDRSLLRFSRPKKKAKKFSLFPASRISEDAN